MLRLKSVVLFFWFFLSFLHSLFSHFSWVTWLFLEFNFYFYLFIYSNLCLFCCFFSGCSWYYITYSWLIKVYRCWHLTNSSKVKKNYFPLYPFTLHNLEYNCFKYFLCIHWEPHTFCFIKHNLENSRRKVYCIIHTFALTMFSSLSWFSKIVFIISFLFRELP